MKFSILSGLNDILIYRQMSVLPRVGEVPAGRRGLIRNCPEACEGQIKNQPGFKQINLINQLDEDDKTTILKIINTMLTKKKFKDFFQQWCKPPV